MFRDCLEKLTLNFANTFKDHQETITFTLEKDLRFNKDLKTALMKFNLEDPDGALEILKSITQNKKVKGKALGRAHYNDSAGTWSQTRRSVSFGTSHG